MPSNDDRKITLDEIQALLEKPPLIRGESEEDFWKWFSVFVDEHQPESFSDWLEVHDIAVKQWEKNRLQRSNSALIEAVMFQALRNLVKPFCHPLIAEGIEYATKIAHDFYFGDDEEMERARDKLVGFRITEDQILAEAMQMRAKELVVFDRMDNYRTNAQRNIRKGLDRRSEARRDQFNQPDSTE
jgi:hypothetical protein